MDQPSSFLVDYLIEYANENGVSLESAAKTVVEFAKQRAPEKEIEERASSARANLRERVFGSTKEFIVARFLVRRRVRYVRWTYYPEFHVVGEPRDFYWSTIHFPKPWSPKERPAHYYLDDLFHDSGHQCFWMTEPYLAGLPASQALFEELSRADHKKMDGVGLRKIDPRVYSAFKDAREKTREFSKKRCEADEIWESRPYGNRGWKKRVALVPVSYKKVRFR